MTLAQLIKELQQMQEWTDDVGIADGSFRLHDNGSIEMNTYEGQPLGVSIRMRKELDAKENIK